MTPYQEFENQGYTLAYNPPGDGNSHFSAASHQLQTVGILRSAETLREEVCRYLEEHDSAPDGMPLELYKCVPWSHYLKQMARDGTYGDQLTLQAIADMFNVQLDIISSSGEDYTTHTIPQYSAPIATLALGHFTEDHVMHYASLTESHDREDQNQEEESSVGMSKNKDFNPGDSETLDINLNKDLSDEIVDMIFQFIFSGPKQRALVDYDNALFSTCRRFRRIVVRYPQQLPQIHLVKDIAPGWHSILSLCRGFGKWSGLMIQLRRIIDSNRWNHAWVYLMYIGIQAWFFVKNIKWNKRK